jgi:pimeloyl-ACP methyl ester carboxylesterase
LPSRAEHTSPPKVFRVHRYIEVDGRSVRYAEAGKGEPLVLVHGLAGSSRWWSALIEPLAAHRHVYAVDLPRFARGFEKADLGAWLSRFLDATGLPRVDLAGHSLGGIVATELAATSPARVRRLVLVAPAGISCGRSFVGRALPLLHELADIRRSLPIVVGDALRTGPVGIARGIEFVWTHDIRPTLPAVRAPTLLVWGDRDRLVPTRIAAEWHELIGGSRIVHVRCGHVPMLEAPGELADCIIEFLDEEPANDIGDEVRTGVVNGMGLAGNHDQSTAR